jgi:hypothetical protein
VLDWLPRTEPKRTLTIFGLVALFAVVIIVPLSMLSGDEGVRDAIEEIEDRTEARTTYTPPPTSTSPPPTTTTPPPPPPTTPNDPPRPPQELRIGMTGADNKVEFTVRSLREVKRVKGNSRLGHGPIVASGRGSLAVAEVTYVNRMREPLDPFCGGNSAELVDKEGRTHETIRNLYEVDGNDAVCAGAGALSGDKRTVTLVFRLKRDQNPSHLDLWNGKFTPDFDGEATRLRFRR